MTGEQTRYQRDKARREAEARHERIVSLLSGDIVADFDRIKDAAEPGELNCDTRQYPNPWVDWDRNPDQGEDYEREMPSEDEAKEMCEGCPLMVKNGNQPLCYAYARATNRTHGIWGGIRIYNGTRVGWGNDS